MCWSSSTLFFGAFVKSTDLCMAARVWRTIKPVLNAVDLVELRRREGTLRFEEGTGEVNAGSLPSELWEKIKDEVCDMERVEAEDSYVRQTHWANTAANEYFDRDEVYFAEKVYKVAHLISCDWCVDDFLQDNGFEGMLQESSQVIDVLLSRCGLRLISESLVSANEWPMDDPNSLSPISLTLPRGLKIAKPGQAVFEEACVQVSSDIKHESPGGSERFAKLSPSDFTLPCDAHARFRTLFRLFPSLQQTYASHESLPSEPIKSLQKKDTTNEGKGEEQRAGNAEPAWHLWTDGCSCS